ncbi:MAG TPA: hypothetical protein VK597_02695, partial [Inquilinus sp.]|nr:hypothetical protein [Inquilinus sp.]
YRLAAASPAAGASGTPQPAVRPNFVKAWNPGILATIGEVLRLKQEHDEVRRLKLERLREELAKGEADLAADRVTIVSTDEELDEFFARL